MSRFLLRKSVAEGRWLLLACWLALFAYSWMRVWLVSQLEMEAFQNIILEVWDDFQKFSPVPLSQLFTYTGRIARTYTEPVVVVCVAGWAIARGSDCVSGELGRGTMEMVLAQPVSRGRLVLTSCLVTTVGSALLALAVWAGIWIGIRTNVVEQTVTRPLLSFSPIPLEVPNPWGEEEVRTWGPVDAALGGRPLSLANDRAGDRLPAGAVDAAVHRAGVAGVELAGLADDLLFLQSGAVHQHEP
jgi:ABC-2 type transport system permease protein